MRSEHVEQRMFVGWWRATFPDVRIFAVPNGGGRSDTEGALLKDEGLSPGVPDLCCPEWFLWVEMKRIKGGKVSDAQADWHRYLKRIGQTVIIGLGYEDARDKVIAWRSCEQDYRSQ